MSPSSGHVEAGVRLPGHLGGSDRRQLQGRDPGAAHGPGQDEESHHQTLEAPDGDAHPRQLPGRPAELRLQPRPSGRLRHLKPLANKRHCCCRTYAAALFPRRCLQGLVRGPTLPHRSIHRLF